MVKKGDNLNRLKKDLEIIEGKKKVEKLITRNMRI